MSRFGRAAGSAMRSHRLNARHFPSPPMSRGGFADFFANSLSFTAIASPKSANRVADGLGTLLAQHGEISAECTAVTQKHVLVVDDDPMILEVIARALTSKEVRVSVARRVTVARDVLMRQTVDLVIADARMPGESGIQLAKAATDIGIASIVMSGDREWTLDHGIPDGHYLAKPFDLRHLQRIVTAFLDGDGPVEIAPPN